MGEVYIIHGRASHPNNSWFTWLANELQREGIRTHVPKMPNPYVPSMRKWVKKVREIAGKPSKDKYFIGHSLGCQAILRAFEGHQGEMYGGTVLVAPFHKINLDGVLQETKERLGRYSPSFLSKVVASLVIAPVMKWCDVPLDWEAARKASSEYSCVFSSNDHLVKKEEWKLFEDNLGARCHYLENGGHLNTRSGFTSLPELKNITLEMIAGRK